MNIPSPTLPPSMVAPIHSHSLFDVPPETLGKLAETHIRFHFKAGLTWKGYSYFYLKVNPDVESLMRLGHLDYNGRNALEEMSTFLTTTCLEAIHHVDIGGQGLIREQLREIRWHVEPNPDPVVNYLMQWILLGMGKSDTIPGPYVIAGEAISETAPLIQTRSSLRMPLLFDEVVKEDALLPINPRTALIPQKHIKEALDNGFTQVQVLQALIQFFSGGTDVAVAYTENGMQQNDALLKTFQNHQDAQFIVCSYDVDPAATLMLQKHQIAVMIHRTQKEILYIDSLQEDRHHVPQLKALLEIFPGYVLKNENQKSQYAKQSLHRADSSCCGMYTFLNIRTHLLPGAVTATRKIQFSVEALREEIKNLLVLAQSVSVEYYMHQLMKQVYVINCAFLDIPLEEQRYPMEELYTNLSLITEVDQQKREAMECDLRFHERDTAMEALHAREKETRSIELKEIFEPKDSRKAQKVLLVGRAGVGKTTLCQKIAYDWAKGELWPWKFKSVIWIPLRQLNERVASGQSLAPEKFPDLEEWLISIMREIGLASLGGNMVRDELRDYLIHHRSEILILLDGYDEAKPLVKESIKKLIAGDRNHPQPLYLLILSRPGDLAGIHACTDTHVESIGFSEEQSRTYATRFFAQHSARSKSRDVGNEFMAELDKNPMMKGLSSVPLQLQMMCRQYRRNSHVFATGMAGLYSDMVTGFFDWAQLKGIGRIEQRNDMQTCLGAIAKAALRGGQLIFPGELIGEVMTEYPQISVEMILGCGLIKAQGNIRNPEYIFLHLTFQEYLAADYLMRQGKGHIEAYIVENKYKPQFQLVFQFLSGLMDSHRQHDVSWFFETLEKTSRDLAMGRYHDMLILRCLNECEDRGGLYDSNQALVRVNTALKAELMQKKEKGYIALASLMKIVSSFPIIQSRKEIVQPLIEALRSYDKIVREGAAKALGELRSNKPEVIQALTLALKDSNDQVRRMAARVLRKLRISNPEVIQALIIALNDSACIVQDDAALALMQLGNSNPELIQALLFPVEIKRNPSTEVTAIALSRLARNNPEVIRTLIFALNNSNNEVRDRAVRALGRLKDSNPEVIQALLLALKDSSSWIKQKAAEGLMKWADSNPEILRALILALQDSDAQVRSKVVEVLGNLDNRNLDVIEALISNLRNSDDIARGNVVEALGKLGNSNAEVIQTLILALQDSSKLVRSRAAKALGKLENSSQEVIEALISGLRDSDYGVRIDVAKALEKLGNSCPKVMEALISGLKDSNDEIRKNAAQALALSRYSNPELIRALIIALWDSHYGVREYSAMALGNVRNSNPEIIQAFMKALKDSNYSIRCNAAEALGKLGNSNPEIIQALIQALKDTDYWIRGYAVAALGKLGNGNSEVIKALIFSLRDSDGKIKAQVANALGNLSSGNPEVAEALIFSLRASEDAVKVEAADALRILECVDPEFAKELLCFHYFAKESDLQFRPFAVEALGNLGCGSPDVVATLLHALKDSETQVRTKAKTALRALFQDTLRYALTTLQEEAILFITEHAIENQIPLYTRRISERVYCICTLHHGQEIQIEGSKEQVEQFEERLTTIR